MRKALLLFCLIVFATQTASSQVNQFPQVCYNGQGSGGYNLSIRSQASMNTGSVLTYLGTSSEIGTADVLLSNESYGKATWMKVYLPSTNNSVLYAYMLVGQFYCRINESNNYATTTANLNIRVSAGANSSNVTISGTNATYGIGSVVALTGVTAVVSGTTWYQVYLPNNCSQAKGYMSGAYLNVASPQSYRIVAGTVENANAVSIWGATVNIGGWTTNSSEGFYQFKVPAGWNGDITCTHSSYSISTPASYNHTATNHSYDRNFILSNSSSVCSYSATPATITAPATGGNYPINITAQAACQWTSSAAGCSFVTINSGANGSGNGNCTITVSANTTGSSRSCNINVAGKNISITQQGGNVCNYTLNPADNLTVPRSGTTSNINITASSGCSWAASPSDSWIIITAATSGTGNGSISYTVLTNSTGSPRTGTITIGSETFTITQAGSATTAYIAGTVKDVSINMASRSIQLSNYAGCRVTAYKAGTSQWVASTVSSASATFSLAVPAGTYDIRVIDTNSSPNMVKVFSVAAGTTGLVIKVPSALIHQLEDIKVRLINLHPTISSIGNTLFGFSHNVARQEQIVNQWKNITTNNDQVIEAASRLYLADSVLRSFYLNADKLNNEIAQDVYELSATIFSFAKIVKTLQSLSSSGLHDALVKTAKYFQDFVIDQAKKTIEHSMASSSSESFGLKVVIIRELDRLKSQTDKYSVFLGLVKPIIENIAAGYVINTVYIQPVEAKNPSSQYALNYADNKANALSGSGSFNSDFTAMAVQIFKAENDAELYRASADSHRNASDIAGSAASFLSTSSSVSAAFGLIPLAAFLQTLAITGKLWSFAELTTSIDKAVTGFYKNRGMINSTVNYVYRSSSVRQASRSSSVVALASRAAAYNSQLSKLKADLFRSDTTGTLLRADSIIAVHQGFYSEITNAFVPISSVLAYYKDHDLDSAIYSRFTKTLELQPKAESKFHLLYLSYLLNPYSPETRDSLAVFINQLLSLNNLIPQEFASIYTITDTMLSLDYLQAVESTIPKVIEAGTTKACKVRVKNTGAVSATNVYALISTETPLGFSIDSVYLGSITAGSTDSLSFNIAAANTNTVATYSIAFYSDNSFSEDFAGAIKIRNRPAPPYIAYNSNASLGDTLRLYANGYSDYGRYRWSGPAGFTSLLQNPLIPNMTVAQNGTYSCTFIEDDLESIPSTLTVNAVTRPKVLHSDTTICKGSIITLHADSLNIRRAACERSQLPMNLQMGLTGYYPFCGSAADASPTGNHGQVMGSPVFAFDRFHNPNSAIYFPGNDASYVNVPGSAAQTSNIQSWSFWILLAAPVLPGSASSSISRALETSSCEGVTVYEDNNFVSSQLKMCTPDRICSAGNITGGWHHMVLMFEPAGQCSYYVDGILVNSQPLDSSFHFAPGQVMRFGRSRDYYWQPFRGYLDDIAIYNRLLTPAEVSQLYSLQPIVTWSTGDTGFDINVSPDTTTTYYVTVTDGLNVSHDSIKVIVEQPQVQHLNLNGCNSVVFNNISFTSSAVMRDTLRNSRRCDSIYRITVISVTPSVVPAVTISSSANPVCSGSTVVFNASIVNGGTAPTFNWLVNGHSLSTASSFSTAALNNKADVKCVVGTNASCATKQQDTSNTIIMDVIPVVTPAISITAPSNICEGTPVMFSAAFSNGGAAPAYQWKLNGVNIGTNSATYITNALKDSNVITCEGNSSLTCLTSQSASSNVIILKVTKPVTPSVTITASSTSVCQGTPVIFTASPVNGGNNPLFTFSVNGIVVQSGPSNIYSAASLSNNDTITCTMISNLWCITASSAVSNKIGITIRPLLVPSVSIAFPSGGVVCEGKTVHFVASAMDAGSNPSYEWNVNNQTAAGAGAAFQIRSPKDGSIVTCVITPAPGGCYTKATASSNIITVKVKPLPVITMNRDTTIIQDDEVILHPSVTGSIASAYWLPVGGLSNAAGTVVRAIPQTTTVYRLYVRSADGCDAEGSVTIKVLRKIDVSNAFSPNGDGINDTWNVPALADYPGCSIKIFDRHGGLVFESTEYNKAWDGTLKTIPLPIGTYYYIITAKELRKPKTGYVMLVR